MKRTLPILLILALLLSLSACGGGIAPTELQTESTTAPLPSQTDTTSPPDPSPPSESTEPPITENLEIPIGSSGVKSDFSSYSPSPSYIPAKYTRLSPEPLVDLRPVDKDTLIYPFVGCVSYSEFYGQYALYGIVDADGCILADPVYITAYPLKDYNYNDDDTVYRYWELGKPVEYTVEYDGESYQSHKILYCLASMDGRIVTDPIYRSISASDGRIIAERDHDDQSIPVFDIYSPEGKLLTTSKELYTGDLLIESLEYSEGMYRLYLMERIPEEDGYTSYHYVGFYFLNEASGRLLGPYRYASPFSCGRSPVTTMDDQTVYIDKKGNILSQSFEYATDFRNGLAHVYLDDPGSESGWVQGVIDTDMNILFSTPLDLYLYDDYWYVEDERRAVDFYNTDGELQWGGEVVNVINSNLIYHYKTKTLENRQTGQTLSLPGAWDCDWLGSQDAPLIQVDYNTHYVLYSANFRELAQYENYIHTPTVLDPALSETYILLPEGQNLVLYNHNDDVIATYPKTNYDNYICYSGAIGAFMGRSGTQFYNAQGELIFSYPLSNPMDD